MKRMIAVSKEKKKKQSHIVDHKQNTATSLHVYNSKDSFKTIPDDTFFPDVQKALIITNSNYNETTGFQDLLSTEQDGNEIWNFLHNKCYFNNDDIVHLQNPWEVEIASEIDKLNNLPKDKKKFIFVYYSGHGAQQQTTGICTVENSFYPLEEKIREVAAKPNFYFIVLLDCCRVVEFKVGTKNPLLKTPPQMYFLFAAAPGSSAIAIRGMVSPVTQSFINLLSSTKLPWPACLDNWTGTKAELTFGLQKKLTLYLLPNMLPNTIELEKDTIPAKISAWKTNHLIMWLKQIGVETEETIATIKTNQYHGRWLFNRYEDTNELAKVFKIVVDLEEVQFNMKKWIKNNPQ